MRHDQIVSQLRQMLIDGEIAPGARVPERELCLSFGISRTPLREALKVLAAEGYLVLLPNRGARASKLSMKDVFDLFDVCEAMEAIAGELACRRITPAELDEIKALNRTMKEEYERGDLPAYYRCNRLIHEAIVKAAGNAVLSGIYESVVARIRRARFVAPILGSHWELAMREHDAMVNALERRDGEGLAHILKTHLRNKRVEAQKAGFVASDAD